MKLVYLESCSPDLDWFHEYYLSVFPDGRGNAYRSFQKAKSVLKLNPEIGHPSDLPGLREFSVARTPFEIIYRIRNNRIEVVHLWDLRARRPDDWD